MEILTAGRLRTTRRCLRQSWYRYELGLVPINSARYLLFGTAIHKGIELHHRGTGRDDSINAAIAPYDAIQNPTAEQLEDRETIRALLSGYFWYYTNDPSVVVAAELKFLSLPIVNPATKQRSKKWIGGGKIDAIVRRADGRLAVRETKTTGEDISPGSQYWPRLQCDPQISHYILGARSLGYDVELVEYDAIRKPSIAPKQIPILDGDGLKVVVDSDGNRIYKANGEPRQSASTENNWSVQSRTETPEEFGMRLLQDISERPEFYFQRREINMTDADILDYKTELWQEGQHLTEVRKSGRWFRNPDRFTCASCEYAGPCLQRITIDRENVPVGFKLTDTIYPELEE